MNFAEIIKHLDEDEAIITNLKNHGVDIFIIKKIENALVRDMLVFVYTSYHKNVQDTVMIKVKHCSNKNQEIVRFVMSRIKKMDIKIDGLRNILETFNPKYAQKFKSQLNNKAENDLYSTILTDRIKAAHEQGNNLQIASLSEIRNAHEQAQHVLEKFESCMW